MPRGDKSKYTDKQVRQAEHIAEGYKERGASKKRAARIGWATVNKQDGGGKKSGSGRGEARDTEPSRRGGEAPKPRAKRASTAKKGAAKTSAKRGAAKTSAAKTSAKKGAAKTSAKRGAAKKGAAKTTAKRGAAGGRAKAARQPAAKKKSSARGKRGASGE